MKELARFTVGYIGYFLIGFIAIRALSQYDTVAFAVLSFGSLMLLGYVHALEKKHGAPKYGGYVKLALGIAFVFACFVLFD